MTDSISLENLEESYKSFILVKGLAEVTDKSCNLKQVRFFFWCLSDNRMAKANFHLFFSAQQDNCPQERNYYHESTVKHTTILIDWNK